ncbi:MAG: DNA starvation/stationary phase protection protein Dps [Armatimonadetes bacterium]|nr:DNA starvation/stationary phase protection protein Dps [Armatimonadota bacterium]
MAKLNPTKNSLPEDARKQLVEHLNERLATLIDLQLQSKQLHWTLRSPHFIALHELLDELVDDVSGYADLVAERAAQLGGIADGTLATVTSKSVLDDLKAKNISTEDLLLIITDALGKAGGVMRESIDWTDDLNDAATSDIFTEITRGLDAWLWKFEAHQGK